MDFSLMNMQAAALTHTPRAAVLLVLATTLLACQGKPQPTQLDPATLVAHLYTQAVARQPDDLPVGADWQAIAPYLSASLIHHIDDARACATDWQRHDSNAAHTAKLGGRFGIFFGGPGHIAAFAIQKSEAQPNGSQLVYVTLTADPNTYLEHGRVAATVILQNGNPVVDDILYVDDNTWDNEADRRHHLLTQYLAAGCKGPQWIGAFLPNQPDKLAQSLYDNVIAHVTSDIPSGADWKIFAPYLSQSLLKEIDAYTSCMAGEAEEYARYKGPPLKGLSLSEFGIFSGGDEEEAPRTVHIEKTEVQPDSTVRVTVKLAIPPGPGEPELFEWPVMDIFARENGRMVLKDIIFPDAYTLNGKRDTRPPSPDFSLSESLAMKPECDGPHWTQHLTSEP